MVSDSDGHGSNRSPETSRAAAAVRLALLAVLFVAAFSQDLRSIVRQARRSLDLTTRDLDHRIYSDAEVVQSIRDLVLGNRRARVRILVRDPAPALQQTHRLVGLALWSPGRDLDRRGSLCRCLGGGAPAGGVDARQAGPGQGE